MGGEPKYSGGTAHIVLERFRNALPNHPALATAAKPAHTEFVSQTLNQCTAQRRDLVATHPSGKLTCLACAHRCKLVDGARGSCLVRERRGDALSVPWGYTAGVAVDPIEKKPFYHLRPGARALSFGMLGCNFHCAFCQNWMTSQTLRDPEASARAIATAPKDLVDLALEHECEVITSTYNEPLITSEWAFDIFTLAKPAGLITSFVSNGHATREVIEYLGPVLDACKIDLKSFSAKTYASLGGRLSAVTESIETFVALGVWVEVVTLVVPGLNDSAEELRGIARFLAGVSREIPWHLTAFHPDYEMTAPPPTPVATLRSGVNIGREAGLRHVYVGNIRAQEFENTICPGCGAILVRREGFFVTRQEITDEGRCPSCGGVIAGIWKRGTHLPIRLG